MVHTHKYMESPNLSQCVIKLQKQEDINLVVWGCKGERVELNGRIEVNMIKYIV